MPDMQSQVVLPLVHSNGTSADELIRLREEAQEKLGEALHALRQMAPNGRDYYLDPGRMDRAVAQHDRRLADVNRLVDELSVEILAIDKMKER